MRQSVVKFVAHEAGEDLFNVSFDLPEYGKPDHSGEPTERQRAAVESFYCIDAGDITAWQAHVLLTYRDYARGAVKARAPSLRFDAHMALSRWTALFICSRRDIAGDVTEWADRRWVRGNYEENAGAMKRTKRYTEVIQFLSDAVNDMRECGALSLG